MKSSVASVILLLSLAAVVSCQMGQGSSGSRQKPGSCYRPGGSRYRREAVVHTDEKNIEKRQIQILHFRYIRSPLGTGGSQGGNVIIGGGSQGGNGNIGSGGGSQGGNGIRCSNDYDCQGNKKCCSGNCLTPAFVG